MKTRSIKTPQFITDKKGKKLLVVLSISDYSKILADLEELDDIRLYDAVKPRKEKTISLKQYLAQRNRRKKNA
jgi:hypothetical protein